MSLIEWLCLCWILRLSNLQRGPLTSTPARIYHKPVELDATATGTYVFHLKLLTYYTMACCHYKRLVESHLLASDDTIEALNIHHHCKSISPDLAKWLPST